MKQSLSLLLIIGVSIMFFGCSENNLVPALDDPAQLEQVANLKSAKKPAANKKTAVKKKNAEVSTTSAQFVLPSQAEREPRIRRRRIHRIHYYHQG